MANITWNETDIVEDQYFMNEKQLQQKNYCRYLYDAYQEEVNMSMDGKENVRCPPHFDGILCWPSINAGQNVTLPCLPYVIDNFTDISGGNLAKYMVAIQICHETGNWLLRNIVAIYGLCIQNSAMIVMENYNKGNVLNPTIYKLKDWYRLITSASYIGYAISFVTIIFAMTAFCLFKKHRNPTNKLHMHLFATFIMKAFITLLKYWQYSNDGVMLIWNDIDFAVEPRNKKHYVLICKFFNVLWNYSIMANYSWMLMEGLYLYNLISLSICTNTNKIIWYILLGWGLPCLIIVVWLTIRVTTRNTFCWGAEEHVLLSYIIRIPILIFVFINLLLFFKIICALYVKQQVTWQQQENRMQYRRWMRSSTILMPLFGVQYFFFQIFFHFYHEGFASKFYFQILSGFQGTFVALLYCLLKGEIRAELQLMWKTHWSKRGDYVSSILGQLPNNRRKMRNRMRHRSQGDDINPV